MAVGRSSLHQFLSYVTPYRRIVWAGPVLLLDEPTSALDAESESLIKEHGRHETLVQRAGGLYRRYAERQLAARFA